MSPQRGRERERNWSYLPVLSRWLTPCCVHFWIHGGSSLLPETSFCYNYLTSLWDCYAPLASDGALISTGGKARELWTMWPDYRNECHLNAHLYSLMCCAGQCVCSNICVCVCVHANSVAVECWQLLFTCCQRSEWLLLTARVSLCTCTVHILVTTVMLNLVSRNCLGCRGKGRDISVCVCVRVVVCGQRAHLYNAVLCG